MPALSAIRRHDPQSSSSCWPCVAFLRGTRSNRRTLAQRGTRACGAPHATSEDLEGTHDGGRVSSTKQLDEFRVGIVHGWRCRWKVVRRGAALLRHTRPFRRKLGVAHADRDYLFGADEEQPVAAKSSGGDSASTKCVDRNATSTVVPRCERKHVCSAQFIDAHRWRIGTSWSRSSSFARKAFDVEVSADIASNFV